jgi:hypothetical protein
MNDLLYNSRDVAPLSSFDLKDSSSDQKSGRFTYLLYMSNLKFLIVFTLLSTRLDWKLQKFLIEKVKHKKIQRMSLNREELHLRSKYEKKVKVESEIRLAHFFLKNVISKV